MWNILNLEGEFVLDDYGSTSSVEAPHNKRLIDILDGEDCMNILEVGKCMHRIHHRIYNSVLFYLVLHLTCFMV